MTKTIKALNSLGREKDMTLEEFLRRHVHDLRHLASSEADLQLAEKMLEDSKALLTRKFVAEYELQTGLAYEGENA